MINVEQYFNESEDPAFRKIRINNSPLGVYLGMSIEGLPSIAFLSKRQPIRIDSTKYIEVDQWYEKDNVYWTKFSLLLSNANSIFYTLCEDFIRAVMNCDEEYEALNILNNRYIIWKQMFRKSTKVLSEEIYKGLLGELCFLLDYAIPKYGIDISINAWSGPEFTAKDFSVDETWYEVKSTSVNSESVRITSLSQLSSDVEGHLVVVAFEKMSSEFNDGKSSVAHIIAKITDMIENEETRERFMAKVANYGYCAEAEKEGFPKFKLCSMSIYLVKDGFPRITEKDVKYSGIVKVSYNIAINSMQEFLEECNDEIIRRI